MIIPHVQTTGRMAGFVPVIWLGRKTGWPTVIRLFEVVVPSCALIMSIRYYPSAGLRLRTDARSVNGGPSFFIQCRNAPFQQLNRIGIDGFVLGDQFPPRSGHPIVGLSRLNVHKNLHYY